MSIGMGWVWDELRNGNGLGMSLGEKGMWWA